jgi:hypothetical protein
MVMTAHEIQLQVVLEMSMIELLVLCFKLPPKTILQLLVRRRRVSLVFLILAPPFKSHKEKYQR